MPYRLKDTLNDLIAIKFADYFAQVYNSHKYVPPEFSCDHNHVMPIKNLLCTHGPSRALVKSSHCKELELLGHWMECPCELELAESRQDLVGGRDSF